MKLHSSLEPDLAKITKAFMKDGVVFLDDTGTRTIEQVEDIEYAMLEEIGPIADAYPTEITEYEYQPDHRQYGYVTGCNICS